MSAASQLAPAPGVTLNHILDVVCDRMDRSRADVIGGEDRSATTLRARHIVMWLARRLLRVPHADIGRSVGGRESGVVMNAEARIEALRVADPVMRAGLAELEVELRATGAMVERAGLTLRAPVDPVAVAQRVVKGGRAAMPVSVAEIEALARHVLQHVPTSESHHV